MNVQLLNDDNVASYQNALEQFEAQFCYPLGSHHTFSISHANDYTAFYRSMGKSYCLIVELKNVIIGTFCCAIRDLHMSSQGKIKKIAYLGDLKVSPSKQRSTVYYRLASTMFNLIHQQTQTAIGIVMDGTKKTPDAYTGRLQLPQFFALQNYSILRFNTKTEDYNEFAKQVHDRKKGIEIYHQFVNTDYLDFCDDTIRSEMNPIWLHNKAACGKIEDTRKVKRLFLNDGKELLAAHLSNFTFQNSQSGYFLIQTALHIAKENNFDYLFLSLNDSNFKSLSPYISTLSYVVAPATLYCNKNSINFSLPYNSAEI